MKIKKENLIYYYNFHLQLIMNIKNNNNNPFYSQKTHFFLFVFL